MRRQATPAGCALLPCLSVGTQEQIALLLRLSIAEALDTFIVLDDQLTQSDPARMTWMRNLLEAAAARIQVVVMTCHPEHYAVADGRRHVVDLSTCVRRRTLAAAPIGLAQDTTGTAGSGPDTAESGEPAGKPAATTTRRRSHRHRQDDNQDDLNATLRLSLRKDSSFHEGSPHEEGE